MTTTTPEQVPTRTAPLEPETRERTASDVLLAAARYIEEHGWWQDRPGLGDGSGACASNAISFVAHDNAELANAANRRLLAFLGGQPTDSFHIIFDWNDAPDRTEAQVIRALRDAAR